MCMSHNICFTINNGHVNFVQEKKCETDFEYTVKVRVAINTVF